jgi:uncharacterized repeat protein (TIGR01451 family)
MSRVLGLAFTVLALLTVQPAVASSGQSPLAPPSNDDCMGALVVNDGPFPLVTAPIDITAATPQDVGEDIVTCTPTDRTVWWSFTPTEPGGYVISTCAGDNGATGSTVYDTVLAVLASTDGECPPAGLLACNDSAIGCFPDVPGAPYVDQSTITMNLNAGTTYFIVAGHWSQDTGGVAPGFQNLAIKIERTPEPVNDTCSAPTALMLNHVTKGTTDHATNDYRSDVACFTGIGQTPTTSAGADVVFSFLPPADGKYSFRYVQDDTGAALRTQNPVLYLSHSCPDPAPGGPVVSCNPAIGDKGANRLDVNGAANGNRSEEIDCVPLSVADGAVYLYFDDRTAGNPGGPMAVEVTGCTTETEPNGTIATANPYPGCATRGAASTTTDVDFYDLGAPPFGSKVFVGVDAVATNDGDFELRVTNATDTLGYDDNDGSSWTSPNAPVVAGALADGNELYARVNKGSIAVQLTPSEPYRLYARVETGAAQNEVDTPSNASYYDANVVTGGGFVKGVVSTVNDQDCFRFVAREGDELVVFSDNNPSRLGGTITNVWPILRDVVFLPPTGSRFTGQVVRNVVTPSPGTLTGVTPSVTSEWFPYRARYTGTYMACFLPTTDVNNTVNPPAGAYPLPYQGSISLNCGPIPAPASRVTDVAVTLSGPAGPVNTGTVFDYTITLTNTGSDIAQDVRFVDTLLPQLTFMGANVNDGFGGYNVGCLSLPTPGTSDAPIDCTNFSIAPGASTTFTLKVQVANCIGAGINIANSASITMLSTDPNASNNSATSIFQTTEDGSCQDLLCDDAGCFPNGCTINDHCEAGTCVSQNRDCDDNSVCTDDSCDPFLGYCINDSSQIGDCCGDGNPCTQDYCDPVLFCVFPPGPAGVACDDFNSCTSSDQCDAFGMCGGQSPCDDGLPCTYDFSDPGAGCSCTHDLQFPFTPCDDENACTSDTTCDGSGGTIAACTGGVSIGPDDVVNLHVDKLGGAAQISWNAATNATAYDVVRGTLSGLPAGPGGGDESCLGPVTITAASDATIPPPGQGFFYLIRGKAACGPGPYGTQGLHGAPSTQRTTATCGS